MRDVCTLRSTALPPSTRVAGFRGSEGISKLYVFEIYLLMTDEVGLGVDLGAAVGAQATLSLDPSDGRPPFLWSGVFATVELIHEHAGRSLFRAVLVPRLHWLTQSQHSRIFTGQSIPDIVKAVLQESGISGDACAFRLLGAYRTQEHVCQYRESDFDFISRWMEREGIYYYFEQDEDGERLVLADDRSVHRPLGDRPARYVPQPEGHAAPGGALRAFTCRHTAVPASIRLKDYDYANPALDVSGKATVYPLGVGEISLHGARFFSPAEGARLARLKAEALRAGQVVHHGDGAALYLRPGYTFEIEEHPRPAFNALYLATEIEHWCNQAPGTPELQQLFTWNDFYRVQVTAIPASVQYRAPERTAWPRIYGTENAVIDGPSTSNYAQIDEQGRYAIKFHFDESPLGGGKASTWTRMLQPHGGTVEGFHFPLRAGTEVMCTFLGGDPDRPVIAGVAPNAVTPSPVTAGNYTKNVIQTGGRNRLELEDLAGQQRVTLSTPTSNSYVRMGAPNDDHNMIIKTDGATLLDAGQDLDVTAGGHKFETITGEVRETYRSTKTEEVTGRVTETYDSDKSETVKGDLSEDYQGSKHETVKGDVVETYNSGKSEQVAGDLKQTYGGKKEEVVAGDVTETYQSSKTETVTSAVTETYGDQFTTVLGSHKLKVKKNNNELIEGNISKQTWGTNSTAVYGDSNSFVGGLRISATLGAGAIALTAPIRVNIVGGVNFNLIAGLNAGIIWGAKLEDIYGFKGELITGIAFKNVVGGEIKDIAGLRTAISNGLSLESAPVKLAMRAFNLTMADFSVTTG